MVHYWPNRTLSPKAQELVEFDMASVRLLRSGKEPTAWLVSTDQYERGGRIFRDSTSPRLLAYYPDVNAIYVSDGCNACTQDVSDVSKELLDQFQRLIKEG